MFSNVIAVCIDLTIALSSQTASDDSHIGTTNIDTIVDSTPTIDELHFWWDSTQIHLVLELHMYPKIGNLNLGDRKGHMSPFDGEGMNVAVVLEHTIN